MVVASAIEMVAARQQQQWLQKIGLQDLKALEAERRQKHQDKNDGGRENLAWKKRHGGGEVTERRQ